MSGQQSFSVTILRRPWLEWVLWAVWLAAELFLLQNAVASSEELEPRAAMLFSAACGVGLAAGAIVWWARRQRLLRP